MSAPANLILFVGGALTAGYALASLFFLRFWVRTRDRLFAIFSLAFLLMGLNQGVSAFARSAQAEISTAYLLRLAAFVLIIIAILSKSAASSKD